jgi:hypothetical protein
MGEVTDVSGTGLVCLLLSDLALDLALVHLPVLKAMMISSWPTPYATARLPLLVSLLLPRRALIGLVLSLRLARPLFVEFGLVYATLHFPSNTRSTVQASGVSLYIAQYSCAIRSGSNGVLRITLPAIVTMPTRMLSDANSFARA